MLFLNSCTYNKLCLQLPFIVSEDGRYADGTTAFQTMLASGWVAFICLEWSVFFKEKWVVMVSMSTVTGVVQR